MHNHCSVTPSLFGFPENVTSLQLLTITQKEPLKQKVITIKTLLSTMSEAKGKMTEILNLFLKQNVHFPGVSGHKRIDIALK